MNKLNVFNVTYLKWRYPKGIISNLRTFFRCFRWSYQRIVRGYSDYDLYDLDRFYMNLFSSSLNKLADVTISYPPDYSSIEDWQKDLRFMSNKFYSANEENNYYDTPKSDAWFEAVRGKEMFQSGKYIQLEPELSKQMFEEDVENQNKRFDDFTQAWDLLGKVFFSLWD